jgi:hypothetical protein
MKRKSAQKMFDHNHQNCPKGKLCFGGEATPDLLLKRVLGEFW